MIRSASPDASYNIYSIASACTRYQMQLRSVCFADADDCGVLFQTRVERLPADGAMLRLFSISRKDCPHNVRNVRHNFDVADGKIHLGYGREIFIASTATSQLATLTAVEQPEHFVRAICASKKHTAYFDSNGTLGLIDIERAEQVARWSASIVYHRNAQVQWQGTDSRGLVLSCGSVTRFFDERSTEPACEIDIGSNRQLNKCATSADGRFFAALTRHKGSVLLFDVRKPEIPLYDTDDSGGYGGMFFDAQNACLMTYTSTLADCTKVLLSTGKPTSGANVSLYRRVMRKEPSADNRRLMFEDFSGFTWTPPRVGCASDPILGLPGVVRGVFWLSSSELLTVQRGYKWSAHHWRHQNGVWNHLAHVHDFSMKPHACKFDSVTRQLTVFDKNFLFETFQVS